MELCSGTWRTYGVFSETDLTTVPSHVDIEHAATPATAYRLLNDFVELKEGISV
jgi:NADPH:quinone reductase-like Zn-dependent oxidoreductase